MQSSKKIYKNCDLNQGEYIKICIRSIKFQTKPNKYLGYVQVLLFQASMPMISQKLIFQNKFVLINAFYLQEYGNVLRCIRRPWLLPAQLSKSKQTICSNCNYIFEPKEITKIILLSLSNAKKNLLMDGGPFGNFGISILGQRAQGSPSKLAHEVCQGN